MSEIAEVMGNRCAQPILQQVKYRGTVAFLYDR